jgi:hypothetical protein
MAKFGKKVQETVKSVMDRMKSGKLKSGSGKKVTNRKQAVAIGLSEAREKGARVPAPKKSTQAKSSSSKSKTQRGPVSKSKTSGVKATSRKKTTASKAKK